MADKLPDIQKEIEELDKRAKRPLDNSSEGQKERDSVIAETLVLSAKLQGMMPKAEYGTMVGGEKPGTSVSPGLMAAAQKLADTASGIPGGGPALSPVGQMLSGYRQRQARRDGVAGMGEGAGGGVGRYSGGAGGGVGRYSGGAAGVPGDMGTQAGTSGAVGGGTGVIDRSRFKAELDANPALRQKIMMIAANENNDPRAQQAVMETMMNRAAMRGKTLASEATWVTEHGYYDDRQGKHRGINAYNNPTTRQGLNARLNAALGGSNISNYGTGNASGSFVEGRINRGMYSRTAKFNGESFVTEGPGYQKWRQSLPAPRPGTAGGDISIGSGRTGLPTMTDADRAKENPDWGKERYSASLAPRGAGRLGGNESLIAAGREASKYLPPGWKAVATSGNRPGDSRFHGKGMAVDWQLYDEKGRALANYQNTGHFRAYEQFAQDSHRALEKINPELAKNHRWGGYFSGNIGKGGTYGAMDIMHQDVGLHGAGMNAGSWEGGLNSEWSRRWGISNSQGMGRGTTQYQASTQPPQHEGERQQWPGEKEYKGPQRPLGEPSQQAPVHTGEGGTKVSTGIGLVGGQQLDQGVLQRRPLETHGDIRFEGFKDIDPNLRFQYGSGHAETGKWSVPYGTFPVTPQDVGPRISGFYRAHGMSTGGAYSQVWNIGGEGGVITGDPHGQGQSGIRAEVQIHAQPDDIGRLYSAGCLAIPAKDMPAFRKQMEKVQSQGGAVIEIGPGGTRIIPATQARNAVSTDQAIQNQQSTGNPAGHAERVNTEPFGSRSSIVKTSLGGSAFSIGDGYFITAKHYIGDAKSLRLEAGDEKYHADIIHQNAGMDYALLKTSPQDAQRLQQAGVTSSQLATEPSKTGEILSMQGYSGRSGEFTAARGKIIGREDIPIEYPQGSGRHTAIAKDAYLMIPETGERNIDTRMPGTSGGAVTDESGQVQGLVSGGGQGPQGLRMFSTPIHQIIEDIPEDLRKNIPQLRERMKQRMEAETAGGKPAEGPGVSGPYGGPQTEEKGRKLWPGEKEYKGPQKGLEEPALGADGKPARGQPSQKQADGKPAPQAVRAKEQARGSRTHIPGKSLAGVNPELRGRIEAMYKAAPTSAKAGFYVISSTRSKELQAKLFARYQAGKGGIAAPPGHSQHEIGKALDLRDPSGWFHKHAREFGLQWGVQTKKGGRIDRPHFTMDPSWKGQTFAREAAQEGKDAAPRHGEVQHERDTRPHEIEKNARARATQSPGHAPPKPQTPHRGPHQKTTAHQAAAAHHHQPIKHSHHFAAQHHAKSSGSTNTRVQHSYRTKHAVDESFAKSGNPNAETA